MFLRCILDSHKAASLQLVKVDAEIERYRPCSSVEKKWLLQQSVVADGQALGTQSSELTAREG